jgi:hypothetical protein
MSQQVVIFDSADNTGKTNIARELCRRTGLPYFKNKDEHQYFLSNPGYFIDAIRYVDTYFTSYLEATKASIVLDRAWPSEWVYSQVMDRSTDIPVLRSLDDRHAAMGTKIIIPFRTDYSAQHDRYDAINENIDAISDLYKLFAVWSNCDTLLLNVDDEDLDRELAEVTRFLGIE